MPQISRRPGAIVVAVVCGLVFALAFYPSDCLVIQTVDGELRRRAYCETRVGVRWPFEIVPSIVAFAIVTLVVLVLAALTWCWYGARSK